MDLFEYLLLDYILVKISNVIISCYSLLLSYLITQSNTTIRKQLCHLEALQVHILKSIISHSSILFNVLYYQRYEK
jgi:hypothetical protein